MPTPRPDLNRARGPDDPPLLCVGLLRTGTSSLCAALEVLGLKSYHGLHSNRLWDDWVFWERASEATWPHASPLPHKYPDRGPLTRADWEAGLLGRHDAITDLASFFAPQLIAAYPDAKVVLTTRDPERWQPSFRSQVLAKVFMPFGDWYVLWLTQAIGFRRGAAMRKMLAGYFGGLYGLEPLAAASAARYEEHCAQVRALVSPERLLEYRVGKDGWEPLCKFLGKEVPKQEFPKNNEADAHDEEVNAIFWEHLRDGMLLVSPYALGIVGIVVAWRYWRN